MERSESPISRRFAAISSPSLRTSLAVVRASYRSSRARSSISSCSLVADGPRLAHHGVGVLLRPGHDRERLARGVADRLGRLRASLGEDLLGLLLGRPHAVLGGAVALGDPLADPLLGLLEHPLGGILGGGDDRGHPVGRVGGRA